MKDLAKQKSDFSEKQNAIAAFSLPEASELLITSQFFAALRKAHLYMALKRLSTAFFKIATLENVASYNSSTASSSEAREGYTAADNSSASTGNAK